MLKRVTIALFIAVFLSGLAWAGGMYIPPDLSKVPGYTVIISSPTEPSQAVKDSLQSYGINPDNILWRDTSAGGYFATLTGRSVSVSRGTLGVSAGAGTALPGYAMAASSGILGVDIGGSISISLPGKYGTASSGSLVLSTGGALSLPGRQTTATAGALSAVVNNYAVLAGKYSSVSPGTITMGAGVTPALLGQYGAASAGTITAGTSGGGPTAVTDNFNRANGGLGANWTTAPSSSAPNIVSNSAVANSIASAAYWNANVFADNQYSRGPSAFVIGNAYRVRQSVSTNTYYSIEMNNDGDGEGGNWFAIRAWKCVAGTRTQLGTVIAEGVTPPYPYMGIFVTGTTISLKSSSDFSSWSTITTRTDSAISSGNSGIGGLSDGIDIWEGGDL